MSDMTRYTVVNVDEDSSSVLRRHELGLADQVRLLDLSNDSIFVRDLSDRIVYWNHGAERLYGWRRQEVIGKVTHDLLQTVFPEPLGQIRMKLERDHQWSGELGHTCRDGTHVTVDSRWVMDLDAAGRPAAILETNNNITEHKRVEQALGRAVKFNEAIMLNMGEGLYTVDTQGLVNFMNPAAERLFGWTLDELRGRKMHDVIHYKHRDGTPFPAEDCAGLIVLREGKELTDHEDVFIRKDGRFFDVSYSSSPLREGDEIIGLVVVFRDVTERKQAEAALRESEARYRETFDNAAVGIAHVGLDGSWMRFNEAVCRITGYTQEELQTKTFADVTHPDDIEPDWAHARRLLAGEIATYSMEKRYIRKDGGLAWINLTVSLQRDATGSPSNFISIIEDVTTRKRVEEALRENETRFRTLADNMSQLAWMADATGWLFWYNRRWYEYSGTTFEDMQGWGWEKIHHPEHVARVVERWRRAHATGEPWEDTFPLRDKNGTYRWFLSRAMPIRDAEGTVTRWFGTNTEITELREIQTALRQSEERLRSFSSQLEQLVEERTRELVQSQDRLRLLATELNLAEQRERKRLAAELHDYLAQLLVLGCLKLGQVRRAGLPSKAEDMVKETEEVLTQALGYSRTLMAELSPSVVQEHGLAAGLKWLGEQMQRQGLMVRVEVGDASSLALTNDCAFLLFQSVRELLMNVLKHAGCQKVVVRLQEGERRLCIEVRDDGVGFDLAAAAAAAAGSSTTALSSKFGLFSIHERMTALGGWFDMQSAPGEGTTATLVLPLDGTREPSSELKVLSAELSDQVRYSEPRTQNSKLHQQHAKIRVLLVDDHAMVRQGLRSVLDSYADIEVVGEARDGEEAVTATEALHPAVVLMDVNMPRMNGIEGTAHIKVRHPEVIVIGLSVNAGRENEVAMKQAGAAMLLTKEAAVDELYRAILTVLRDPPNTGQRLGEPL
jgi:PAS domain S-box-containing protein